MKDNKTLIEELEFCLNLWEQQGYCEFGQKTKCDECASPYILLKLITGEVLHGKEIERLTISDWKRKLNEIKKTKDTQ